MFRRLARFLIVFGLLLSSFSYIRPPATLGAVSAAEAAALQAVDDPPRLPAGRPDTKTLALEPVAAGDVVVRESLYARGDVLYEEKDAVGPATYIIQLEGEPLASYRGGIRGLNATSPAVTGVEKLDVESPASRSYLMYLDAERVQVLTSMGRTLGRTIKVLHTYDYAYYGMAVEMTPDEAASVAQMPGVRRVIRNFERYIQTDVTPEFINARGIWNGTNAPGGVGTMGEGIVVGIIDTGINMDHPSFAATGDDGYTHTNPLGADNYRGWCNPADEDYDPTLVCNAKLIGVYSYPDSGDDPEDDHSHGSHTASTAAGNVLRNVTYEGYTFDEISGMAPHANIIAYDVCVSTGCQVTSILAAINDAIADRVDVINYSIGGGPQNPWDAPDSEAYLNAREAGVFVATSAGNDGPDPGTLGSPANSPWMISVANTTIGRIIANTLDVTGPGDVPPALMGIGAIRGPEGPAIDADIEAAIVFADDNIRGCIPFPTGFFTNSIALIQRGGCTFADKVDNATDAGAIAVVIFNNAGGPPMSMGGLEGTTIPSVFISLDDGRAVVNWIQAKTNPTARINAGSHRVVNPAWADILAASSSRGPNVNADLIKPDIAAPGTNIFAAYAGDAESFGMMSGTSMASPHVAGAGALMKALHDDWSDAEIQSALMMTSKGGVLKEDASTDADPFDVGAGRLDLTGAALAGLVLDETKANFEAADPAGGGDPTTLNLASLGNSQCLQECSWERTFRNTTGEAVTWEISSTGDVTMAFDPVTFTIAAGATQVVEFTADVSGEADDIWLFGEVMLTADADTLPDQHLPVAVLPTSGILPSLVEIHTRRNAGSQTVADVQAIEITDLTVESFGLVQADVYDILLDEDPTYGDPYDDLDQVFFVDVSVPSGAKRLVAEVTASEAPDVDLFVLYDDTGTGDYDEVCDSMTYGWAEYCDLTAPPAGDYLIVVQNWEGSADQPDAITLAVGVVPGTDAGNMMIDGPESAAEMEPFDLQVLWNIPEMVAGDRWYGAFSLGTAPGKKGDIGTIPVNIIRHGDDVVKTASSDSADLGETVTYTITIQPNVTPDDLTYMITDTIPAGLTYVPGSVTATVGTVDVTGDTLTWTGMMRPPSARYLMTTSLTNEDCAVPYANSGAYLDLSVLGIAPQSVISGDRLWFSAFGTGDPFNYWGADYTGINFTDDGMAFFDSTPGGSPGENEDLPNPADPNNLLAMFWNDWEIVYDEPTNRGVSLASLGGLTGGIIIEYDDVQPYGDPSQTIDFEVFMWRTPDPSVGDPDIIFAYDNINLDTPITVGTIGIENALGTEGIKYAYDDDALGTLVDGMAICFDWSVQPANPVYITYQVTVDQDVKTSPLTNVVEHTVDNQGSLSTEAAFDLTVKWWLYQVFLPMAMKTYTP